MNIYREKKKQRDTMDFSGLSYTERVMRIVAICVAFASVFYFFLKLLFF